MKGKSNKSRKSKRRNGGTKGRTLRRRSQRQFDNTYKRRINTNIEVPITEMKPNMYYSIRHGFTEPQVNVFDEDDFDEMDGYDFTEGIFVGIENDIVKIKEIPIYYFRNPKGYNLNTMPIRRIPINVILNVNPARTHTMSKLMKDSNYLSKSDILMHSAIAHDNKYDSNRSMQAKYSTMYGDDLQSYL